ncbi:FAD-binding oxidoreductase [Candidatus Peregrinibacteria bacterium]|nr:FAD-binding oxidoreductase [Candidatus Peregrinibacteria bacterium]
MKRSRVAIIGAGIFGVSCALELSAFCDVTLFDQNDAVLMGGTYRNQYRHHYGYHYPRSPETVIQCQNAEQDFKKVWGKSIRYFPAYYGIAHESKVTANDFRHFCETYHLPYEIEYPAVSFLNSASVIACFKTPEPVYDFSILKKIAEAEIKNSPHIKLSLGQKVIEGGVSSSGTKIFTVKLSSGDTLEENFDFAVNATYANYNMFCEWFDFEHPVIEFRLKELVVVKLPTVQQLAITVVDGPFVTIVPLSEPGYFTLGDVSRSIHDTCLSSGGIPWSSEEIDLSKSHFYEMKKFNPYFIPLISQAEYVKSIFTVLPIRPNVNETDERLTSITNHGLGCWSVFEGKIVTSVSTAKMVAKTLAEQMR